MISTAFVPARIAIPSVQQIKKTIGLDVNWRILQNHYPINEQLNDKLLQVLFEHNGISVYDAGQNLGLSGGLNYLLSTIPLQDDDIVLATDLDVWPVTSNWGQAIVDVLRADSSVGWVSLQNQHSKKELAERGFTIHSIGGHVCYEGHTPCVQSIIGWSAKSLKGLGELKEQQHYYGGGEVTNHPRLKKLGLKWVYLPQYEETYHPYCEGDRSYVVYKWNYSHLRTTKLSFKDWLLEDPSRLELK